MKVIASILQVKSGALYLESSHPRTTLFQSIVGVTHEDGAGLQGGVSEDVLLPRLVEIH